MKKITIFLVLVILFSCTENKKNDEIVKDNTVKNDTVVVEEKPIVEEVIPDIIFTVQIAALKNKNQEFSSLANVKMYEENGLNKYRVGQFYSYQEAKQYRLELLSRFKGAFIQALKKDKPISIKEALH